MDNSLNDIFDSEKFRQDGHKLIDTLADYLSNVNSDKVRTNVSADDEYKFWENREFNNNDFIKTLIDRSIHLHNNKYMGHQVSAVAPYSSLLDLTTSLLNNGMAVYEMGSASSAIENWVVKEFCNQIGFSDGDGFLTSGGTLATLTAILTARNNANIPKKEYNNYYILTSNQTHYCAERAANILGLGGVIKVNTNDDFTIDINHLKTSLEHLKNENKKALTIIGSACSTSTGSYDNLIEIGQICSDNNIWFHVDGAHGGCAITTNKYRHLIKGIEKADSVIIDLHKMYLTPALATVVAFKDQINSYKGFQQDAEYLWDNAEPDWFNYGKRTFECTKLMMSVKFYGLIDKFGWETISNHIEYLYDLAKSFAKIIAQNPNFELAVEPQSNIVCFRFNQGEDLNFINKKIHQKILEDGEFYIVKTELNQATYLRTTLMNPTTTDKELKELLNTIEKIGNDTNI